MNRKNTKPHWIFILEEIDDFVIWGKFMQIHVVSDYFI